MQLLRLYGYTLILTFSQIQRETVESELTFLGLLIMENRLKKETKPVLKELSEARIRTVMITGMGFWRPDKSNTSQAQTKDHMS